MARTLLIASALAAPLVLVAPCFAQMPSSGAGAEGSYAGQYEEQGKDGAFDHTKVDMAGDTHADPLVVGASLVKHGKYADAIAPLETAQERNPRNVTTFIYLGFAHRMLGDTLSGDARAAEFDKARGAYQKGLAIDPDNRLLHEYLGKLYLLMREYDLASQELKKLDKICSAGCDERAELSQAIIANPPPPKP